MLVVQVPSILGIQLFTEWLQLEETCRFDSAVCNVALRPAVLELFANNLALFEASDCSRSGGDMKYFNWLTKRRISVNILNFADAFPGVIYDSFDILRDTKTASTTKEINFIGREAYLLSDITLLCISEVVSFCMETLKLNNFEFAKFGMPLKDIVMPNLTSLSLSQVRGDLNGCIYALLKTAYKVKHFSLTETKGTHSIPAVRDFFVSKGVCLEAITLNHCDPLNASIYRAIAEHCHYLTSLTLVNMKFALADVSLLAEIAAQCPLLSKLSLAHNSFMTAESVLAMAASCLSLEEVDLSSCRLLTDRAVIGIAQCSIKLHSIKFDVCPLLTFASIHAVLRCCRKIVSISAYANHDLTHDRSLSPSLPPLRSLCGRLSVLNLSFCERVSDDLLVALCQVVPNLAELSLKSRVVSDQGVNSLLMNCFNMKRLYLDECVQLTDITITNITKYCKKLQRVSLNNNKNMSSRLALEMLTEHCRYLRYLSVLSSKLVVSEPKDGIDEFSYFFAKSAQLDEAKADEIRQKYQHIVIRV